MLNEPQIVTRKPTAIAGLAILLIGGHLILRYGWRSGPAIHQVPLVATLLLGGTPLVWDLLVKLRHRQFGSDVLAGISIVTSVIMGEFLAGSLVVLMLSGGEALEAFAVGRASSVLRALSRRMPSVAHVRRNNAVADTSVDAIAVGDTLVVFPHEICPVDGVVVEGHGVMDESYLTGEPYLMSKTPGSAVLSGSVNGDSALTIRAEKLAVDSRYAKIMEVMRASEENRPQLRRLGDQLGALYTPLAVALAVGAWLASGQPIRFLAVMVVATPCPLLIAIPVAIIGSISLAARRGIVVKNPVTLEKIGTCRTAIFDKTGTLTYGEPHLTEQITASGWDTAELLQLVASLERYSKHPLAGAILRAAEREHIELRDAAEISERPGHGLHGTVSGRRVQVTGRRQFEASAESRPDASTVLLPPPTAGMECLVLVDGHYAATYRFRDEPREDGALFINHLAPRHQFDQVMIVSGDRESEVRYLAERVGIQNVHFSQSPEQKVARVRAEVARANTVFLGDGINDAPALLAATVGVAFGQNSDVTSEAAGVVILDSSLAKVDEFLHIGRRMRSIALQSAVGGMTLSVVGMVLASMGYLPPVAGAVVQEMIDVVAVLNALRAAWPPRQLADY